MGGEWDTDVVQISMKNGRNEASDNALESPSAVELVSIKFLVAVDIWEGGADVTTRSYPNLWGRVGYRRRSDLNDELSYQR